jgi:predicted transcriptional regulator with HTH domain
MARDMLIETFIVLSVSTSHLISNLYTVYPVSLYGSEVSEVKKKDTIKIQSTGMTFLK